METTTTQVPTTLDPKVAEAIKEKILARRTGESEKPVAPILKGYSKVKTRS